MDPKCLLTSTDLQTRRARCQHQLSFLFLIVCECCYHLMVNKDVYIQKYQDRTEAIQSLGWQERHPACRNSHTQSKKNHYSSGLWETRPNLDWSEEKNCSSSAVASLLIILLDHTRYLDLLSSSGSSSSNNNNNNCNEQASSRQPPRYSSAPCKLTISSYLFAGCHLFRRVV